MGTVLGKDIEVDVRSSGSSSKRPSKDSSPQKSGGNSNKVYAELISDGSLPSDLPTIKVLINDSLATTAVDQLRDSQVAAHELSKSLIVDVLTDKHTPPKLGIILQSIFSYESLLQPTRDLIYWSIQIPSTFNPIYQQTKQTLNYVDVSN